MTRGPRLMAALLALGLGLEAAPALAQPGSADHPIVVRMKRGTDRIRLTGVLRQGRDCCAYAIAVRAGQTLNWSLKGPATRQTITDPAGHTDGPGIPAAIPLTADGTWIFTVRPNLMADGAYGRFTLTLTIPPLKR
ncbi:hypothetical protein ACO2Q3_02300 [Caulobacter sp. KR2-114]|uniref:hypothetical protein n=1 Tax=Caulobacter sp. KR2-114 TaxID=3400912 RepID=UPI003BFED7BF